jgi:hypothetical protein
MPNFDAGYRDCLNIGQRLVDCSLAGKPLAQCSYDGRRTPPPLQRSDCGCW